MLICAINIKWVRKKKKNLPILKQSIIIFVCLSSKKSDIYLNEGQKAGRLRVLKPTWMLVVLKRHQIKFPKFSAFTTNSNVSTCPHVPTL